MIDRRHLILSGLALSLVPSILSAQAVYTEDGVAIRGTDPVAMLGETDAYKLRACATLFEAASPTTPVFAALIDDMFGGQRCTKTLRILRTPPADDLFA